MYDINDRVYYVNNGPYDTGTVIAINHSDGDGNLMFQVIWDTGDDPPDWFDSSQISHSRTKGEK